MSGFIYKSKSTASILDTALAIATYDTLNEIVGHTRESLIGEVTATRTTPNDYGTQYNNPTYEYGLVKCDDSVFTDEEQITIETWLSSPKRASELVLLDDDGNETYTYLGKFISTEWVLSGEGYSGVKLTFQASMPYPYLEHTESYSLTESGTITIDCETDELEEYCYPTITFYANDATETVVLTNTTDDDNTMTLNALHGVTIVMDCDHCTLSDSVGDIIDFDDLGWDDVGNIYWLRLLSGENELTVTTTGAIDITISYKGIVKKAGGWL